MAYVDERTQKFLDNIISGASNEELFKMQRAPASKPMVGPPTAVQDIPIVDPENVQNESVVEGSAMVRPLEISTKSLVGQTPDYMQNVNRSIEDVANLKNQYILERQMAQEQREKNQATLEGALTNLQKAAQPRVRTPEEIERLKAANERLGEMREAPERDMMSEAILSFGPALLGSLTGESGALSAPAASKQARDLYEAGRKEDITNIQKKNEQILKNYENILKIDKQSAEDYLNNQKLLQQQADVAFKGAATLGQMSQKEAQAYDQKIVELQKAEAAATQKGAEKVADIEMTPGKEAAKNKRAVIIASGQGLKDATKLRQEFEDLPEIKTFRQMQPAYDKLIAVSKDPSAAGDISMVYSFMKMQDANSAILPGEYATAQNAGGVDDKVRNIYNKLVSGEFLTKKQRSDFVNQAKNIYNAQQKRVSERESDYGFLAGQYGTNVKNVIPRATEQVAKEPIKTKIEKLDDLLSSGRITKEQYNKFKNKFKGGK